MADDALFPVDGCSLPYVPRVNFDFVQDCEIPPPVLPIPIFPPLHLPFQPPPPRTGTGSAGAGSPGPAGPRGPTGPGGPTGPPGPTVFPTSNITLYEEQVRCVDGLQIVYQRSVTISLASGQLAADYGDWYPLTVIGCCDMCDYASSSSMTISSSSSAAPAPEPVPPCCDFESMPATATLSYLINGTEAGTLDMVKSGVGYEGGQIYCDADEAGPNLRILLSCILLCNTETEEWTLRFEYVLQLSGNTYASVIWDYGFSWGTTYAGEFSLSCSPFRMHFEGFDTISDTNDETDFVYCDLPFFGEGSGNIFVVLDLVTP